MTRFAIRRSVFTLAFVVAVLAAHSAYAQLTGTTYVNGLTGPIGFIPDPTNPSIQYVVEQTGRIRVISGGTVQAANFLDMSSSISLGAEQGLLGLAFPPDYETSRRFFINFTDTAGNTVVARFLRSATDSLVADPSTRFDLKWPSGDRFIVQPFANHNGGHLVFGSDGYLYIGMGDGGSGNDPFHNAQNPNTLLGKMLRIDVNVSDSDPEGYDVPPDNPFRDGDPVAALGEIWAFGLRNPWHFSFDDPSKGGNGAMLIGDVGQNAQEEVDYQPPGRGALNYGWRNREGTRDNVTTLPPAYLPLTEPILSLPRDLAGAITGGFVYRGVRLGASYRGRYFFADFGSSRVYSIALTVDPNTGNATQSDFREHTSELGDRGGFITAIGVDANGEIYLVYYSSGEIVQIDSLTPCSTLTIAPATLPGGNAGLPYATTTLTQTGGVGTVEFAITNESLPAGLSLSPAGVLSGTPSITGSFTFTVTVTDANGCTGTRTYTLAVACPAITIAPAILPSSTPGVAYPATTLTQAGGAGSVTFAITSGSLPAGMSLSPAGVLSGAPPATGSFTFTVTATDANGCMGAHAYTLVIGCATLTIAPASLPAGAIGRAYSRTLSAAGATGTPVFSIGGGTLPPGLSLSSSGALTGTPAVLGRSTFSIVATDSVSCSAQATYAIDVNRASTIATGADAGGWAHVISFAFDGVTAPAVIASYFAYDPPFGAGVRVAVGDVTGDGVPDVISAPGLGSLVRVANGANGILDRQFFADPSELSGGVYVAAGDVNGDGVLDIVTGSGSGPPVVRIFDGRSSALVREFFADLPPAFGGVRVAAADLTADGVAEIITSEGPGFAPAVRVFSGDGTFVRSFFAYDPAFAGGVYVAAGDVNGDGYADIVTGAGPGGGPHVRVWNGVTGAELLGFFAYHPAFSGGVRVAAGDVNGDGKAEIITGAGPGGGPHVRVLDGATLAELGGFYAYHPAFAGGVFVAAPPPQHRMAIDVPASDATVTGAFRIAGWTIVDGGANDRSGVEAIHVWAFPAAGGVPRFAGTATLGDPRPDVAAAFGGQFAASGFHLDATPLAPGPYALVVFVFNARTGTVTDRRVVSIVAR